tara:strand:- start:13 stop:582 length:570 start_codon:yes stop_codon:yes gene_type:complete
MEDFLIFFISILVIFIILKNTFFKNKVIRVTSKKDNITYIVRDLPDAHTAADKLANVNSDIIKLIQSLPNNIKNKRLKDNYNKEALSETGIDSQYTSYSLNKGEKISLCLRTKKDETLFEDKNTLIFVMIHELAHIMTESVGHTKEFWDNMKYLLEEAEKINIYQPINYSKDNKEYCGVMINSTPYHFE